MALKALKPKPASKEEFVSATGHTILPSPRVGRTKSLADAAARYVKIMFFGDWGSGKTYGLIALLEKGYKVWVLSTDAGGDGMNTIIIPLIKTGRQDLLANIRVTNLISHAEVKEFLVEPAAWMPDCYSWDPDFLVWDGTANWQQVFLSEDVADTPMSADPSAAVASGLFFEQPQWGMMRNGTVRGFDRFCSTHNKRTGKVWHKIVTCQEDIRVNRGTLIEKMVPLLQGSGGRLAGAAFDLIIRTKKIFSTNVDTGIVDKRFIYQIESDNAISKSRGFDLDAEMPADMGKLWDLITAQLGIKMGAVDESVVSPVLLQKEPEGVEEVATV